MTKNASAQEIAFGVDKVMRGGLYICTAFILRFLNVDEVNVAPKSLIVVPHLSEAENCILLLVAEGLTNVDIAQKLMISVRTVETRRFKLLSKTGTTNTATLIRYYMRVGLIS